MLTRREVVINSFKSCDPVCPWARRCRRFWLKRPARPHLGKMAESWSSSNSTAATTRSTRWFRLPTKDTHGTARSLRLPAKGLIRVNDRVGLHPGPARAGEAAGARSARPGARASDIPTRTALTSRAWRSGRRPGSTWKSMAGRAGSAGVSIQAQTGGAARPASLFVGDGVAPAALRGRAPGAASLERIEDSTLPNGWDSSIPATPMGANAEPEDSLHAYVRRSVARRVCLFPANGRADWPQRRRQPRAILTRRWPVRLQTIARLLKADLGARVYLHDSIRATTHMPAS